MFLTIIAHVRLYKVKHDVTNVIRNKDFLIVKLYMHSKRCWVVLTQHLGQMSTNPNVWLKGDLR